MCWEMKLRDLYVCVMMINIKNILFRRKAANIPTFQETKSGFIGSRKKLLCVILNWPWNLLGQQIFTDKTDNVRITQHWSAFAIFFCSGKAIVSTYLSVCVCVCVCVRARLCVLVHIALLIHSASFMRHIVTSFLPLCLH